MARGKKRRKGKKGYLAAQEAPVKKEEKDTRNDGIQFKLHIPDEQYKKVMYWINKSTNEVSGFGSLDFNPETGIFTVRDVMLLHQEVGPGSTEINPEAMNRAIFQTRNDPGAMKWHWHSHPTFGVFWSGTDMNLIRELGQQGWIVASVLNQKRECRSAFFQTVEILGRKHDMFVDDIYTKVIDQLPDDLMAQLDAEFAAKVSPEKAWTYTPGNGNWKGHYDSGSKAIQSYESRFHDDEDSWVNGEDNAPFLPGFVNRRVAGKTPRKILDSEYTKYGFATIDGHEIYNPCKDFEITTPELLYMMIDDMEQNEIEFLRQCDDKFEQSVKEYIISRAKAGSGTVQDETKWGDRALYSESGV